MDKNNLQVEYVSVDELQAADYNPRKHNEKQAEDLKESIRRFGLVDPLIVNSHGKRKNIVIGGHFRLEVAKSLGYTEVPVVYVKITTLKKEKELNLRLNKNTGEFDFELLSQFDESFLDDIGFSSEELDDIFLEDDNPQVFNLKKELEKLDIKQVSVKVGQVYDLDGSRLMCGDSTKQADIQKLMNDEKADMVLTDPPYILDYLHGKKKSKKK